MNTTSWEERARLSEVLLLNLKENLPAIESLAQSFAADEADAVYRWYHWSFKIFGRQTAIRRAVELFETVSPEGRPLNGWFMQLVNDASRQTFDNSRTNQNWFEETLPILTAWMHCHVFLKNMARSARELESSRQVLPDHWALTLYVFDCR